MSDIVSVLHLSIGPVVVLASGRQCGEADGLVSERGLRAAG